jgi:protein phosphatase 2C
MEENSPVVAMPIISAIDKDVTASMRRPSSDANELDNSSTVIREKKSVFLTDRVPLWGCSSICGLRSDMEDAYVAVPRFYNLPVWMLTQDFPMDGVDEFSKLRVPAHFFGVYDGHGGAQVANYCRDRVHLALIEELNEVQKANPRGKINFDLTKEWEKIFIDCFKKVDKETEQVAPETVGSTAVVAVVSSSHIIVANCGDSRAVLSRGKQAIPLSVDHKVTFYSYFVLILYIYKINLFHYRSTDIYKSKKVVLDKIIKKKQGYTN